MAKKMMAIQAIASEAFSYVANEIIELEDAVADAWKDAGLVVDASVESVGAQAKVDLQKALDGVSTERDTLAKQLLDVQSKLAQAIGEKNGAIADKALFSAAADKAASALSDAQKQLASVTADRDAALAQVTAAQATITDLTTKLSASESSIADLTTQLAAAQAAAAPVTK